MLWFELATKDGCTVDEAQHRYSMREFIEWSAFDRLKGIRLGRVEMDMMLAQVCMYVIAPHIKKLAKYKIKDFMLWKPKEEQRRRSRTPIDPEKLNDFVAQQMAMGNMKRVKKTWVTSAQ